MYSPSVDGVSGGITSSIWMSFVHNLSGCDSDRGTSSNKRLPCFQSIAEKPDIKCGRLPRIKSDNTKAAGLLSHPDSLSEATWREILLGEGDAWKKTIYHASRSPPSPLSFAH